MKFKAAKFKAEPILSRRAHSNASILLFSVVSGFAAATATVLLQWLVYHNWLHWSGPIRLTGSALAGALTFAFALRWQFAARRNRQEMLHRFERIAEMNDRIRNALQVIECVTYAANPQATAPVRDAVDVIEGVLHEVLAVSRPPLPDAPPAGAAPPTPVATPKSA
jgi:hypothetical protein